MASCDLSTAAPTDVGRLHSPFRYPGGKFYARKHILECIPPHTKYCELFSGGASIFFAKERAGTNVLNDKDAELMNCYRCIRDDVEGLIRSLEGVPATKELHGYFKNEFRPKNDLDRAKRWFYLNRTSYSGIMRPEGCYWGYDRRRSMPPERWPGHLRDVSRRLQGVTLLCRDFEDALAGLGDGFFVFADPPYLNAAQEKFYQCPFSRQDHDRLRDALMAHAHRHRFLLTYDNSPAIRELYSWCNSVVEREWTYAINRTDDQRNGRKLEDGFKGARSRGREVFISNYPVR